MKFSFLNKKLQRGLASNKIKSSKKFINIFSVKIVCFFLCAIFSFFNMAEKVDAAAAACSTSGGGAGVCYVDNTCTSYNGNGTSSACAESNGGVGAYNSITNMMGYTHTGDDIIYIRAGLTYAEQLRPPSDGTE